jgi:hypothetical protein
MFAHPVLCCAMSAGAPSTLRILRCSPQKLAFLEWSSSQWMEETAAAFAELGAAEIAVGLRAIATDTIRDDKLLSRVTMDVCLLLHLSQRNYREFLQVV